MPQRRGFGALRRLPSKRWQASYIGPDGARHAGLSTFARKDSAAAWLEAERVLIEREEWTSPKARAAVVEPAVRTLGELWERFLTQRAKPLALATHTSYEQDWRLRIKPHWGAGRDLETITVDDVWAWRTNELARERRRDQSTLVLFSEMLQKAVQWRWIDWNPAAGVSIPRRRKPIAQRHVFDLDDVRRYLEAAEPQHVAMLACVALGGLRSGEVRGLRRRDVDLDAAELHVRQAVEYGLTDDGRQLGVKAPKTSAGARTLPMSQALVRILRDYFRVHSCLPDALVFPGVAGKPMGPMAPVQAHNRALANMGLRTPEAARRRLKRRGEPVPAEDHIHLHDLRASYAAWLMVEGHPLADVMSLLGWSDSRMPLEVYNRVFPSSVAGAAEKQDAGLEGLRVTVR